MRDKRLNLSHLRDNYLFVDVGGGSTEFSFVVRGERIAYASYPIGAVRAMEGAVKKDDVKRMNAELSEWTRNAKNVTIIGSGGYDCARCGNLSLRFESGPRKENPGPEPWACRRHHYRAELEILAKS